MIDETYYDIYIICITLVFDATWLKGMTFDHDFFDQQNSQSRGQKSCLSVWSFDAFSSAPNKYISAPLDTPLPQIYQEVTAMNLIYVLYNAFMYCTMHLCTVQ